MTDEYESEATSVMIEEGEQDTNSPQENNQTSTGLIQRFFSLIGFLILYGVSGGFMGLIVFFAGMGLFALSQGVPIPFLVYDPTSPISFLPSIIVIVIGSSGLLGLFSYLVLSGKAQITWSWKALMSTGILALLMFFVILSLYILIVVPYFRILFPIQYPLLLLTTYPTILYYYPIPYYLLNSLTSILSGFLSHQIAYRVYSRFGCLKSLEEVPEPHT